MRIWVDISAPKDVLFFKRLIRFLRDRGNDVLVTSRKFREIYGLAKIHGVHPRYIGRYGGDILVEKLRASIKRMTKLIDVIIEFNPDVSISFSSPDAARVSYGLGIPHICVSDSPHAEATSKLTIPLSSILMTPIYIPKALWRKYGISKDRILQYRALDPLAWLVEFSPNPSVLKELKLSRNSTIITIRPEEIKASYILGMRSLGDEKMAKVFKRIVREWNIDLVVIPRYLEQIKLFKRLYGDFVKIVEKPIDATSLLHYTSIFIGGGGTMTQEAVMLGVPTISVFPSSYYIERLLIKRGLLIKAGPRKLYNTLTLWLTNLDNVIKDMKAKARAFLSEMEDPVPFIANVIESHFKVDNNYSERTVV